VVDSHHSGDFVHALQVLDDLGLVLGLDPREQTSSGAHRALFRDGEVVKLTAGVRLAGGVLVFSKHADPPANRLRGSLAKQKAALGTTKTIP